MLSVRWNRLLLSMVIIPFHLINLWVELHILINSSLDVQLRYQRLPYSKCGSIIFTTPYKVDSSHRMLIIAYLHYLQRAASHPPKERKLQKMISVKSEKWWRWWWWCVQNKYILLGSKQLDIKKWHDPGTQGKWSRECGFTHTDTRTLTNVLCWY